MFTPGPWSVEEDINKRLRTDVCARGGEDWIAMCGCLNGLDAKTSEDNARLIAAAPEAYELLKAIYNCDDDIIGARLMNDVKKLLSKIEGR